MFLGEGIKLSHTDSLGVFWPNSAEKRETITDLINRIANSTNSD